MTGFERASLALIYNLYFRQEAHKGKPIIEKRFVIETFDEDGKMRMKRYFVVREVSTRKWDLALEQDNRYKVYSEGPLNKHGGTLMTEERPSEKIEVESMNATYVNGLGAGYRFVIEDYGYDQVKIRDEEHRKNYRYKIS